MGVDTYVAIRVDHPDSARDERELAALGTLAHVRVDYVVVYVADRFREVEQDVEHFGPLYAEALGPRMRESLDPRGLLAIAEVGQGDFPPTYEELAASATDGAVWLPVTREPGRRKRRVLLVALSARREQLLVDAPDLVADLLKARREEPIPGTLELGPSWIPLQRVLFDAAWAEHRPPESFQALAPAKGLSYFEDHVVEASRVITRDVVAALADWLGELPPTTVADVAALATPCPASLEFPESLGPCEADDREPAATLDARRTPAPDEVAALEADLARLAAFYRATSNEGKAVLSIRFRD